MGGDNGIYGIDPPTDGGPEDHRVAVGRRQPAWPRLRRGADVFYIGGWNEGHVSRAARPPRQTLSQCSPPDPNISGLAWNGSFGLLWEQTNSDTDTIWLIDPITCEATRGIPHPDGGGFGGAGIELDAVGNIWTVGQNSLNAYLVESGLPTFSDVPWLTVAPTEGTVAPDGTVDLDISVDTTGLAPTSTGRWWRSRPTIDNALLQVPVTLVVTDFQQGSTPAGTATWTPR